ncbi:MAG: metal-sensitive transcriptional regulator [Corynebacterium sp.]|nr:metal-sensitive transcriptional regulator [Corynebacterium sp.]
MKLDPEQMRPAINRLKRAQGQLNAVIRMLEEGEDCKVLLQQLSAASKAVDRAGFTVISAGMEKCFEEGAGPEERAAMEKLFLSLA